MPPQGLSPVLLFRYTIITSYSQEVIWRLMTGLQTVHLQMSCSDCPNWLCIGNRSLKQLSVICPFDWNKSGCHGNDKVGYIIVLFFVSNHSIFSRWKYKNSHRQLAFFSYDSIANQEYKYVGVFSFVPIGNTSDVFWKEIILNSTLYVFRQSRLRHSFLVYEADLSGECLLNIIFTTAFLLSRFVKHRLVLDRG